MKTTAKKKKADPITPEPKKDYRRDQSYRDIITVVADEIWKRPAK